MSIAELLKRNAVLLAALKAEQAALKTAYGLK